MGKTEQEISHPETDTDKNDSGKQPKKSDTYSAYMAIAMGQCNMSRERAEAIITDDEKPNE